MRSLFLGLLTIGVAVSWQQVAFGETGGQLQVLQWNYDQPEFREIDLLLGPFPEEVTETEQATLWKAFSQARRQIRPLTDHQKRLPGNQGALFLASNPGQQIGLRFLRDGVRLVPGQNGHPWQAELRLQGCQILEIRQSGAWLEHVYDNGMTGWFYNRREGLQQGWVIERRPEELSSGQHLEIELEVCGLRAAGLTGRDEDSSDLQLETPDGRAVLAYSGLKAWDSRHRPLEAQMEPTPAGLRIIVRDTDAIYPITIDPLITSLEDQVAPQVTGSGSEGDLFGTSLAIEGNVAVVGAQGDSDAGFGSGSVFVFEKLLGIWTLKSKLTASDALGGAAFGQSVDFDGTTLVVGAPFDGPQNGGAAYVFKQVAGDWTEDEKLIPDDTPDFSSFGASVQVEGDTVVVGAPRTDDDGANSGSAYVFLEAEGSWSQQQKLTPSDAGPNHGFGSSVSLSGETVLIGAPQVNASMPGAAYAFVRQTGTWSEQEKLTPSDGATKDDFGRSVSLDGDTAVIGSPQDDDDGPSSGSLYVFDRTGTSWSETTKVVGDDVSAYARFGSVVRVEGDQIVAGAPLLRNGVTFNGAAYVFRNAGGTWLQEGKLPADSASEESGFGSAVAISSGTVLVRNPAYRGGDFIAGSAKVYVKSGLAWFPETELEAGHSGEYDQFANAVCIDQDTAIVGTALDDDNGIDAGSAYVFTRENAVWSLEQKLLANDGTEGALFGTAVALEGDLALVGASQDDELALDAGAVYAFSRESGAWSQAQKLIDPSGARAERFGGALSLSDEVALIGIANDNSFTGSAAIYRYSDSEWAREALLTASDGAVFDRFGTAVAICGSTAIVGAPFDNEGGKSDVGSAYVFAYSGSGWQQQAKLLAPVPEAFGHFGGSVSVSAGRALVGAPYHHTEDRGQAFVFKQIGADWPMAQMLEPEPPSASEFFGAAVSLQGDIAIVGAPFDPTRAAATGSAYSYLYNDVSQDWELEDTLTPPDGVTDDRFGHAVSLDGDTVLVGANLKEGFGGRGFPAADQGGAYLYRLDDGNPEFTINSTDIDENLPYGSVVGQFTSGDINRPYLFEMTTTGVDNAAFFLGGPNGDELRAGEVFDAETKSSYQVQVRMRDASSRLNTINLTVTINDDRDEDADGDGLTEAQEEDIYGTSDLIPNLDAVLQLTEFGPNDYSLYSYPPSLDAYTPVIACDPVDETVLVVWVQEVFRTDQGKFEREVYAKLYHADGAVAKSTFAVSETGLPGQAGGPWNPAVTFNPESGNYLVVWQAVASDFGLKTSGIIGQQIASNGSLVGDNVLLESSASSDLTFPAIDCDEDIGTYLLAWRDGDTVRFKLLNKNLGIEQNAEDVIALHASRVSSAFRSPTVLFEPISNDFLVCAVVDDSGSGTELVGRIVEPFALGVNPLQTIAPGAGHYAVTTGARGASARFCVVFRDPALKAVLLYSDATQTAAPFALNPSVLTQLNRPVSVAFDAAAQIYYATWHNQISTTSFGLNVTGFDREGTVLLESQELGDTHAGSAASLANSFPVAKVIPDGPTQVLWLHWPSSESSVRILGQRAAILSLQMEIEETGAEIPIPSGSGQPKSALGTSFGITDVPIAKTYRITNTGLAPIDLSGSPAVETTGDADFAVTTQPGDTLLNPGEDTTFQVTFTPNDVGYQEAEVSIPFNSPEDSPFTFAVSATAEFQFDVAAHNEIVYSTSASAPVGGDGSFFLVWFDHRDVGNGLEEEVWGQIIGADGTPLTSIFKVSTASDTVAGTDLVLDPAIATDGFGRFLVVWTGIDPDITTELEAFGQLFEVPADGSAPVPVGDNFQISDSTAPEFSGERRLEKPDVVYHPPTDSFMVIWHGDEQGIGTPDGHDEIFGARISAVDGSKQVGDFRVSESSDRAASASEAHLTWDCVNDRFLIVWQEEADSDNFGEIRGQLTQPDGTASGPQDFIISDAVDPSPFGARSPNCAYQSSLGQFLVVWNASSRGLMGQYLTPDGVFAVTPQNLAIEDESVDSPNDIDIISRESEDVYEVAFQRIIFENSILQGELFSVLLDGSGNVTREPQQLSLIGDTANGRARGYALSRVPSTGDTLYTWFSNTQLQATIGNFTVPGDSFGIYGNNVEIANGDATPTVNDHTRFQDVITDFTPIFQEYEITNEGSTPLEIGAISVTGPQFYLAEAPAKALLLPGETTSFRVGFDVGEVENLFIDTVVLKTSAGDFSFDVACQTDLPGPVMELYTVIDTGLDFMIDGDTSPSLNDGSDFGYEYINATSGTTSFVIRNTGLRDLVLRETDPITIDRAGAGATGSETMFSVINGPVLTTIPPGGETTFDVVYAPTAVGFHLVDFRIYSNDPFNAYECRLQGEALLGSPEIDVTSQGLDVSDGDTSPRLADGTLMSFEDEKAGTIGQTTLAGPTLSSTFAIENNGNGDLNLTGSPIVESSNPAFVISSQPAATLIPAGNRQFFTVEFDPTLQAATGNHSTTVTIENDNAGSQSTYTFTVEAEVITSATTTGAVAPPVLNGDISPADLCVGVDALGTLALTGGIDVEARDILVGTEAGGDGTIDLLSRGELLTANRNMYMGGTADADGGTAVLNLPDDGRLRVGAMASRTGPVGDFNGYVSISGDSLEDGLLLLRNGAQLLQTTSLDRRLRVLVGPREDRGERGFGQLILTGAGTSFDSAAAEYFAVYTSVVATDIEADAIVQVLDGATLDFNGVSGACYIGNQGGASASQSAGTAGMVIAGKGSRARFKDQLRITQQSGVSDDFKGATTYLEILDGGGFVADRAEAGSGHVKGNNPGELRFVVDGQDDTGQESFFVVYNEFTYGGLTFGSTLRDTLLKIRVVNGGLFRAGHASFRPQTGTIDLQVSGPDSLFKTTFTNQVLYLGAADSGSNSSGNVANKILVNDGGAIESGQNFTLGRGTFGRKITTELTLTGTNSRIDVAGDLQVLGGTNTDELFLGQVSDGAVWDVAGTAFLGGNSGQETTQSQLQVGAVDDALHQSIAGGLPGNSATFRVGSDLWLGSDPDPLTPFLLEINDGGIVEITDDLFVYENAVLTINNGGRLECDELVVEGELNWNGGTLAVRQITGDVSLGEIEASDIEGLQRINGNLVLEAGEGTTSIDLSTLTEVNGEIQINNSPTLTTINLSGLTSVGSGITITGNENLETVDLSGVTESLNNVNISGNSDTTQIILSDLTTVGEVTPVASASLAYGVAATGAASSVPVDLLLSFNPKITNITVPLLETVTGTLDIRGNLQLTTLSLPALTTVGADFLIDFYGTSLDFSGVDIGGNSEIYGGPNLTTLLAKMPMGTFETTFGRPESQVRVVLPAGALPPGTPLQLERMNPLDTPVNEGLSPLDEESRIRPLFPVGYDFQDITLAELAQLEFFVELAELSLPEYDALADALSRDAATLGVQEAGGNYRALPRVAQGNPAGDRMVQITLIDFFGQETVDFNLAEFVRFRTLTDDFSNWAIVYYSNYRTAMAHLPEGAQNIAFGEDYDGDGIFNGVEYGLHLNMFGPDSSDLPMPQVGAGEISLTASLPYLQPDVTYRAQWVRNLDDEWNDLPDEDPSTGLMFMKSRIGEEQLFMRWNLVRNPPVSP